MVETGPTLFFKFNASLFSWIGDIDPDIWPSRRFSSVPRIGNLSLRLEKVSYLLGQSVPLSLKLSSECCGFLSKHKIKD